MVNERLGRLIRTVKDFEKIDLISDTSTKLSRTEFRLLREVAAERMKGGEIISSELAKRLGVTRSAISQLVAKMEKSGIIVRASSPVDKKIAYIRLSEKSLALYEEHCEAANRLMDLVEEDLGKEKLDRFFDSVSEFVGAVARAHEKIKGN